ncbi:hypothetical protein [Chryseolinea lacunae]|uniref:DUF4134 domain-containing protein n=1 Tax=Chryseolinea lacunae TaxID=2801331 RepID=A0ABS1KPQ6_9BACT|nr:hypothetical protein [Chryseolinea lacunae]MBL0741242.1 hypothetical protein [Chryseolinea lacunae]
MKYAAAIALLCFYVASHAQSLSARSLGAGETGMISPVVLMKPTAMRPLYQVSRPPGQRMRTAGTIMTLCGSAMIIGGLVIAGTADPNSGQTYQNSNGTYYTDGEMQEAVGVLGVIGGIGLTVPGIILWTKGAKKYNRYKEQQTSINVTGNGLSLSYHF